MRVLGVDCGTERTGWGVIESDGRRHTVVAHGVIKLSAKDPLPGRLAIIAAALRDLLSLHAPECAAVEEVFFSQNVKTALKLAHVRGVALAVLAETGLPVGEYSPLSVKTSVVGYGRAEKHQVQLMVRQLTGLAHAIESEDAADALAVAICHATHISRSTLSQRGTNSGTLVQPAISQRGANGAEKIIPALKAPPVSKKASARIA
jgi:crossover junction endodeoxyribonuclease RuvC